MQSIKDVFQWLDETCDQQIRLGLNRMEYVLQRLGNPERRCKFIHIAGTNGKGTTGAIIASVLQEAGYPVGLLASPEVVQWNERIQMDGSYISEKSAIYWANQLKPIIEEMDDKPSSFEFWTLLAICYFAREALPWFIVWETGLGGRYDATNVVYPLVSVITQVGMDHQELLGDTVTEIAQEKASIIKSGVSVITPCDHPEVVAVLEEEAKAKKSRLYRLGEDFFISEIRKEADKQVIQFKSAYRSLDRLTFPLAGTHQLNNVATACMTLEILRQQYATVIEEMHFEAGLKKVQLPGRMELIPAKTPILLDGAHNEDSWNALAHTIANQFTYDRLFLLIGVMRDKDIEALSSIVELADHIVTTEAGPPVRRLSGHSLAEQIKRLPLKAKVESEATVQSGLKKLDAMASAKDLIVVTGSFYVIREIRSQLLTP